MIIESVLVKNYRSIHDQTLYCDSLTALVGRNGSGKSSFLSALDLFYDSAVQVTTADFYNEDTSKPIEIVITFSELTREETRLFSKYITDRRLTVAKVIEDSGSPKPNVRFHGFHLQHPRFNDIRNTGPKGQVLAAYREARKDQKYSSLPAVRSADDALEALDEWESERVDECELMRDNGQFFGFKGVAHGYLERYIRYIKVPAVRDASEDAVEGKGSCITELMDLVVRNVLQGSEDLAALQDEAQTRLQHILDPHRWAELRHLQSSLTETLQQYVSDASISLDWSDLVQVKIPTPTVEVNLSEDSYETSVERTGHGLQRAFILTMLHHLATTRGQQYGKDDSASHPIIPNLVLAIEEPELYQHPSRQRHFASVLRRLTEGSLASENNRTQVIYSTHSPLFVGLDRFDQIRVLRKECAKSGWPNVTLVTDANLQQVAKELWELLGCHGEPFTPQSLRTRMQTVMTPWMNEGFFADVVVLVEGESDRAALLAVAESMGYELASIGVAVVPCGGKATMDRPAIVFKSLGIRSYLLWDNDKNGVASAAKGSIATNRLLLRIVGAAETDWPAGCGIVTPAWKGILKRPSETRFLEACSMSYSLKSPASIKSQEVRPRSIPWFWVN